MSYYDETCIEKIHAILFLKENRHYPLTVIRNILKKMDQGLTLENAEAVENSVYGEKSEDKKNLLDRKEFLKITGITASELKEAEKYNFIMPFFQDGEKKMYDQEDIRFARDVLKNILDKGLKSEDFQFYIDYGKKIINHEDSIRKKITKGKITSDKINMTVELSKTVEYTRNYIFRRLLQRKTESNILLSMENEK